MKYGFWDEWLPHENPLHSYKCHLNEYRYVEWCSYVFFPVKMLNKDLGGLFDQLREEEVGEPLGRLLDLLGEWPEV